MSLLQLHASGLVLPDGSLSRHLQTFLRNLAPGTDVSALLATQAEQAAQIAALQEGETLTYYGANGITVYGTGKVSLPGGSTIAQFLRGGSEPGWSNTLLGPLGVGIEPQTVSSEFLSVAPPADDGSDVRAGLYNFTADQGSTVFGQIRTSRGSRLAKTNVANADQLGGWKWDAWTDSGWVSVASIEAEVTGPVSPGVVPARVRLYNISASSYLNLADDGTFQFSGPVTAGEWQATPIGLAYGGTGADYSSVTQNWVWASPDGAPGAPSFRALVAADIPSLSGVYQPLDGTLSALAAQNWVANAIPIGSGADTLAQVSFAANTFPARASTGNLVAKTISDDALAFNAAANNSAMRTALGVAIGTNVQAYDAQLDSLATLAYGGNAGKAIVVNGAENAFELVTAGGYSDEQAQDAVGGMVDTTLVYTDGTPLLSRAALTGDVTASAGSNATTIANDAVTYAKMQNVSATDKVLGRSSGGSGDVEEIACTAAGRALLDDADATAQRATLALAKGVDIWEVTILGSDQTNDNAVADTLEDVTGLSFAVTSGTWEFEFYWGYTAALTSTGSRWTISGPTATVVTYYGAWISTASNNQILSWSRGDAWDTGAAVSTASISAGGTYLGYYRGVATVTASGNIILRHASEISGSAITCKAGISFVKYRKIA